LELPTFFLGRVLSVDVAVADQWGHLQALAVRPLPAIDSLLAATALQHHLSLVTRKVKDFSGLGVDVINPWAFDAST
jgi:predicted nucleic acid-binding protein